MKTLLEVGVTFNQFSNISLNRQGIYQLRSCITMNDKKKIQYAQPYIMTNSFSKHRNQIEFENILLQEANYQIRPIISDMFFETSQMVIRYEEQEFLLNEGCIFKFEYDGVPSRESLLILLVELLFLDMEFINEKRKILQPIFKQEIHLTNINSFNYAYVPVTFDNNFCLVKTLIHSLPLQYKFQPLNDNEQFETYVFNVTDGFAPKKIKSQFINIINQIEINYLNFVSYLQKIKKLCSESEKFNENDIPALKLHLLSFSIDNDISNKIVLCQSLLTDFKHAMSIFYKIWFSFWEIASDILSDMTGLLQIEYKAKLKQLCSNFINQTSFIVIDLGAYNDPEQVKQQNNLAIQMREQEINFNSIPIHTSQMFPTKPILFRQLFIKQGVQFQNIQDKYETHVIILVHGYKGMAYDMREWKNILKSNYKNAILYVSVSNQRCEHESIAQMGENLAKEILSWEDLPPESTNFHLSFVGYSLGGIIIRFALQYLKTYQKHIHSLITLGTPHILLKEQRNLMRSGLWYMKRIKQCQSLIELALEDNNNFEDCLMYKLSKSECIGWFKKIVLISTYQDDYVPYDLAQLQRTLMLNSELTLRYNQMINNIMKQIQTDRINRININLDLKENYLFRTWDKFIGRAAHLELIENKDLISMIVTNFDDFFE